MDLYCLAARAYQETAQQALLMNTALWIYIQYDERFVDRIASRVKGDWSTDALHRLRSFDLRESLLQVGGRDVCISSCAVQSPPAGGQERQGGIVREHDIAAGASIAIGARMLAVGI